MQVRRSTVLTMSAVSVLAMGAFGPIASATTEPPGTDAAGTEAAGTEAAGTEAAGRRTDAGGGGCVVGVSWNNYQEERWARWDEPAMQAAIEAGGGSYISNDAGPRPRPSRATSRTSSPKAPTSS